MAFRMKNGSQDIFELLVQHRPSNETLEKIDRLIDWKVIRRILAHGYDKSGTGNHGFDPVILAKMLLLEHLYGLSDVRVAEECADRLSFRKFLGLELCDKTPDDTTLVKFRRRMAEHGLLEVMEEALSDMLKERGLSIRPGSMAIVDATLIEAAVRPPRLDKESGEREEAKDPDARHTVKNGEPHYGYKLHAAQDAATGLITAHEVTAASVHDTNVCEELLSGEESALLADKGYDDGRRRERLHRRGVDALIMKREHRGMSGELRSVIRHFNRGIAAIRGRIETSFGNLKRWRRCGRAVYTGLAKVKAQMTWGIMVHNLLVAKRWMEKCA
jgi:transposase, IS5 family